MQRDSGFDERAHRDARKAIGDRRYTVSWNGVNLVHTANRSVTYLLGSEMRSVLRLVGLLVLVWLSGCATPRNLVAERAVATARDNLDDMRDVVPETPYCYLGFDMTEGYVRNIWQGFPAQVLRLGDRVVAIDGESLSDRELFKKVAARRPGERVVARVERFGQMLELELECRDGEPIAKMVRTALAAVVEQDWGKCLSTVFAMRMVYPSDPERSYDLGLAVACASAQSRSAFVSRAEANRNAALGFDYGKALLAEALYAPFRRNRVEATVVEIIEALRRAGHHSVATDLEAELEKFRTASVTVSAR